MTSNLVCIQSKLRSNAIHAFGIRITNPGGEANQVANRHFQWWRDLRNKSHAFQHISTVLAWVKAIHQNFTVTIIFAEQAAYQGGLAGTVGTYKCNTIATPDVQIDILKHLNTAKALADCGKFDH